MRLIFADAAWEDHLHWQKQDRKVVERITDAHRTVYRVGDGSLLFAQLRSHDLTDPVMANVADNRREAAGRRRNAVAPPMDWLVRRHGVS